LVDFGYPKSLERNAERAARTGLTIVESKAELNRTLGAALNIDIAARIGIVTSIVTVDEGLAKERTIVGEAINMAGRLQSLAGRHLRQYGNHQLGVL
jgi:class 3 adenylate cyclase